MKKLEDMDQHEAVQEEKPMVGTSSEPIECRDKNKKNAHFWALIATAAVAIGLVVCMCFYFI